MKSTKLLMLFVLIMLGTMIPLTQAKLAAAQTDLRKVITVRQVAQLIMMGMLD